MIKITLDTNCILYYLDAAHDSPVGLNEISEIVKYGLEGNVNIAITTRVGHDVETDKDENRKKSILSRIGAFPIVGTVMRFDVSKWDNGDVLSGEDTSLLVDEIKRIVFPNLNDKDKRYRNKISDIDHLVGHKINKRDIFVTTDNDILKQSETLKDSLGIIVMSPVQCIEHLNKHAKKEVLTEEFYEKFKELKTIILSYLEGQSDVKELQRSYAELRPWIIRKSPLIKDGLVRFKQNQLSTPISGNQSMIDNSQILSLQAFNDAFASLGIPTTLQGQVESLAIATSSSFGYHTDSDLERFAINRIEAIEAALLGYLGSLEV